MTMLTVYAVHADPIDVTGDYPPYSTYIPGQIVVYAIGGGRVYRWPADDGERFWPGDRVPLTDRCVIAGSRMLAARDEFRRLAALDVYHDDVGAALSEIDRLRARVETLRAERDGCMRLLGREPR